MADTIKQDQFVIRRAKDLATTAERGYYVTHSDFLDLHEQSLIQDHVKIAGVRIELYGGFNLAERKIALISPSELQPVVAEQLSYIRVDLPKVGQKKQLNHRDYLGSIMNLGIDRKLIGDILVFDQFGIIICTQSIAKYLTDNLLKIGNVSVVTKILEDVDEWTSYVPKYRQITTTVASTRVDSVIKAGTKLTRSNSLAYIKSGKVFVNSKEISSASLILKEEDVVSIRGIGKFRLTGIKHMTKKGRVVIEIDLYI